MLSRIKKAVGQAAHAIEQAVHLESEEHNPDHGQVFDVGSFKVEVESTIAEGGFAKVYLARDVKTERKYALKKLLVAQGDDESRRSVEIEIKVMKKFNQSKFIVTLYDAVKVSGKSGFTEFHILMELCPDGHLIDFMQQRIDDRPGEKEVLSIFGSVCMALTELHMNSPPIIHRDIKPENVLLVRGVYKLCDFGSCTSKSVTPGEKVPICDTEENIQRYTTPSYRAPEMVDLYMRKTINTKADVWAMGCLLYKLCFFDDAFGEGGAMAILGGKYKIPARHQFSEALLQLLSMMLHVDPSQRANIFQVSHRVYSMLGKDVPIKLPEGSDRHQATGEDHASKSAPDTVFANFSNISTAPKAETSNFANFEQVHVLPTTSFANFDTAHKQQSGPKNANPFSQGVSPQKSEACRVTPNEANPFEKKSTMLKRNNQSASAQVANPFAGENVKSVTKAEGSNPFGDVKSSSSVPADMQDAANPFVGKVPSDGDKNPFGLPVTRKPAEDVKVGSLSEGTATSEVNSSSANPFSSPEVGKSSEASALAEENSDSEKAALKLKLLKLKEKIKTKEEAKQKKHANPFQSS